MGEGGVKIIRLNSKSTVFEGFRGNERLTFM